MNAIESPKIGIIIEDHGVEQYEKIDLFAENVSSELDLPLQQGEWGCVSAAGAFIINQVIGIDTTSSTEIDIITGRNADKPGSFQKSLKRCFVVI